MSIMVYGKCKDDAKAQRRRKRNAGFFSTSLQVASTHAMYIGYIYIH